MMQDQKSLTLGSRSYLEGSSDIIPRSLAYKRSQYFHDGMTPLHSDSIIHDVTPKNVDVRLMLMFRRRIRYHWWHLYTYLRSTG
jgi:hypothetical protein